jgi:uncharacterized protein YdcH (DUF465 family)
MYGEHHDLLHELPEHREAIHALKTGDPHFARLFEEYHEVDKEIRRAEQEIETVSDEHAEELKRKRLTLKDELFEMIRKHEDSAA